MGNSLRISTDVTFPKNAVINRHFGVGSLKLPGTWKKMHVLLPIQHQVEGHERMDVQIPQYENEKLMIGHWHRPPLSLVFVNNEGIRVEIGVGSDYWRWDNNLGHMPESGSYKVYLTEDGLEIIREPLMCCQPWQPAPGLYKFSWYLAWDDAPNLQLPKHQRIPALLDEKGNVDLTLLRESLAKTNSKEKYFAHINWSQVIWKLSQQRTQSPLAFIQEKGHDFCWQSRNVQSTLKKIVRQLAECEIDGLVFDDVNIAPCHTPAHLNKKKAHGLAHWDVNAMLDFTQWASWYCRDKFPIFIAPSKKCNLPIITQSKL